MRTLVWVLLCLVLAGQQPPRDSSLSTSGTSIVRGRVTAGDTGAPIPFAYVTLDARGSDRFFTAYTDERGRFEIRKVVADRYRLQAVPPAHRSRYVHAWFGAVKSHEDGRSFAVTAGEVRDGIDVVLRLSAAISGRVVDESGSPLTGVRVHVWRMFGEVAAEIGADIFDSDDRGRFRIHGLASTRCPQARRRTGGAASASRT